MHATKKGQVTIPLAIRRRFVILPETELEFVEERGKIVLVIKDDRTPGQRLVDHMSGSITTGMTTDELMALTRGED